MSKKAKRYKYRCSRCRTRNSFIKPLGVYLRPRKCRSCGYTTFYVDKERIHRPVCYCTGTHYPHRPGSSACLEHPDNPFNLSTPISQPECPF